MSRYAFGPFQVDAEQLLLQHRGAPIALGPKVVETLLALLEHPGELLGKVALLDRIWPEGFVEEANLAQNIYILRKTLKAYWPIEAIQTIPRRGYRFVGSVTQIDQTLAEPALTSIPERSASAKRWGVPRWLGPIAAACAIAVFGTGTFLYTHHPAAKPHFNQKTARLYAIGWYYWNLRTQAGVEKSLSYFAQVVRAAPREPRGYAALADANSTMSDYHYGSLSPKTYLARANAWAKKALALDPSSGAGYAALGLIALQNNKWIDASAQLRHAIALDPSYGPAHEWYGIALFGRGKVREGFAQLQTASDLDPLSVSTTAWLGSAAYLDRRYAQAIAYARQTLELSPERTDVYSTIGLAYEARGNFARSIAAFKELSKRCAWCRAQAAALLANAYAQNHHMRKARLQLRYATEHAKDVDPVDLAIALAAVGERRDAMSWLKRIHGSMSWTAIANDPRFDALRHDAGFQHLTQRPA